MKIYIVTPEMSPFVNRGRYGVIVEKLRKKALDSGFEVITVLPGYYEIDVKKYKVKPLKKEIFTSINERVKRGSLHRSTMDKFPVYFIAEREYFGRKGIYTSQEGFFSDQDERFRFFAKIALEMSIEMDIKPHAILFVGWPMIKGSLEYAKSYIHTLALSNSRVIFYDPFFTDIPVPIEYFDTEDYDVIDALLASDLNIIDSGEGIFELLSDDEYDEFNIKTINVLPPLLDEMNTPEKLKEIENYTPDSIINKKLNKEKILQIDYNLPVVLYSISDFPHIEEIFENIETLKKNFVVAVNTDYETRFRILSRLFTGDARVKVFKESRLSLLAAADIEIFHEDFRIVDVIQSAKFGVLPVLPDSDTSIIISEHLSIKDYVPPLDSDTVNYLNNLYHERENFINLQKELMKSNFSVDKHIEEILNIIKEEV